jgi:hypothetical protein
MRASLDLCLRFPPCDCGLLAQGFFGRFPTAQVVSGTLPYRFADSLTSPATGKSRFKSHRRTRLSSMHSIGSAHAALPASMTILVVSTPDRMLFIIGSFPERSYLGSLIRSSLKSKESLVTSFPGYPWPPKALSNRNRVEPDDR